MTQKPTDALLAERQLTLKQARARVASLPTYGTLLRWVTRGLQPRHKKVRVRLESYCAGGRRFTTEEALLRFLRRINGHS